MCPVILKEIIGKINLLRVFNAVLNNAENTGNKIILRDALDQQRQLHIKICSAFHVFSIKEVCGYLPDSAGLENIANMV